MDQCLDLSTYSIPHGKQRTRRSPKVFCVEPIKSNIDLLNTTARSLRYTQPHGGHFPSAFQIIQATADQFPDKYFHFSDHVKPGGESARFKPKGKSTYAVKSLSVDSMVKDYKLNQVDILSIDTEGSDPRVLFGAYQTLSSGMVRYIEFENHGVGPWKTTKLSTVIQYLDDMNFDCFWAGRKLWLITGAWDRRYNNVKTWSNCVCIRRTDPWYAALNKHMKF